MPKHIQTKTILNKTKKRDEWFLDDYTLNPYSGCSFNCLYCYIRGSKYGINMDDKLAVKENAVELLEKQISSRAKRGQYGFVVLSSATDPYLPIEKSQGLTRRLLDVFLKHQFPVHVITKSDLVIRDFDLLQSINEIGIRPDDLKNKLSGSVIISFSFSTLDDKIRSIFEPGATPIAKRLRALEIAATAGFKTGVCLMPLLPYISDSEEALTNMYQTFKDAGAHYVMPASTTLFGFNPSDSKVLVLKALEKYYPDLIEPYYQLYRNGSSVAYSYQQALKSLTDRLNQQFEIPNRIISQ